MHTVIGVAKFPCVHKFDCFPRFRPLEHQVGRSPSERHRID